MQCNAALAITGAIKGTSQTKLYQDLGLQSFKFRHWIRRFCTLFKIKSSALPRYLFDLTLQENQCHNTCSTVFTFAISE